MGNLILGMGIFIILILLTSIAVLLIGYIRKSRQALRFLRESLEYYQGFLDVTKNQTKHIEKNHEAIKDLESDIHNLIAALRTEMLDRINDISPK